MFVPHEPLEKIFESLKNQLYRNVNNLPLDSSMFCLENTVPKGNYAVFKPDFLCTTLSAWPVGTAAVEYSSCFRRGEEI